MLHAQGLSIPHTRIRDLDLQLAPGDLVGVIGPSGAGKTSLARVLAGLQRPAQGRVLIDGESLNYQRRSRPSSVALIGQHPKAVCNPRWTLQRIVSEPALIARRTCDVAQLFRQVGLSLDLMTRTPSQVSDGQLQRACIARAVAQQPQYLLCDEPTSALDSDNRDVVLGLLRSLADGGVGVLLISHEQQLVRSLADRVVTLT